MRLSRQIFSYSLFNVVNAAVPFLLLPVLTAYLLPQAFGILALVTMLQAILLPIITLNFQGLLTIEYTKLPAEQFVQFVSSSLWLPVLGFVAVFPFLYLFKHSLASLFGIPEYWVPASAFFVLLQALPQYLPVLFQARKQLVAYGLFKIGMSLLNVVLSLFFIVFLQHGWEGRMWGILGALLAFNAVAIYILTREGLIGGRFSQTHMLQGFMFGLPLIPHAISGILLTMADRVFLANLATLESVGIYSVAYQIAGALMIIMSSINQAWAPHLFSHLNKGVSDFEKKKLVTQTYKIMAGMLVGTLVFIGLLPIIYQFFIAKNYTAGAGVAAWISLALMFQGFYFMVTNYIFYVKKTYLLSIMTIISATLIMLLDYILIPVYGVSGAAYAMVAGWVTLFLLAWLLAQQVYPMPWLLTKQR